MAGNSILRFESAHPTSILMSITCSQYVQLWRICSSDTDFRIQAGGLQDRLLSRGYSRSLLKKTYKPAFGLKHDKLLFSAPIWRPQEDLVRFITNYNSELGDLKSIMLHYCFLLTSDLIVRNNISGYPTITFCKFRFLRDSLTTSHFVDPSRSFYPTSGTSPCGSCSYCSNLDTRSSLTFPNGTTWKSCSSVTMTVLVTRADYTNWRHYLMTVTD